MHRFWRNLLDVLYPPRCQVCRKFDSAPLCNECIGKIALICPPVCRWCGLPLDPGGTGPEVCSDCRNAKNPTWARSAGLYEGTLRQAILALKFAGRRSLAIPLAGMLAESLPRWESDHSFDIACPVPLHPSRLRERGFNQAELIARFFCEVTGISLNANLLYRTRPTIPQVALPPKERGKNVRGAFALSPDSAIKDKHILLIDDIYTTGATLKECTKVLHQAGAAEVNLLTLARPRPTWMPQGES